MLVTTLALSPICAFCLSGPTLIDRFFADWLGWLTNVSIRQLIAFGVIVAAICYSSPFLIILFGAVALSTWVGWIGCILFPALATFALTMEYVYFDHHKTIWYLQEETQ